LDIIGRQNFQTGFHHPISDWALELFLSYLGVLKFYRLHPQAKTKIIIYKGEKKPVISSPESPQMQG
jgi:hypothetical protein